MDPKYVSLGYGFFGRKTMAPVQQVMVAKESGWPWWIFNKERWSSNLWWPAGRST